MYKHSSKNIKRLIACMLTPFMLTAGLPSAQALSVSDDSPQPIVVTDNSELTNALSSGGAIKLGSDIRFSDMLTIDKNTSIDFAGYALNYDGDSTAILITAADVSFDDSSESETGGLTSEKRCVGLIEYDASGLSVETSDQPLSHLTFNGGTYSGSFVTGFLYGNYQGEEVVINGGSFSNSSADLFFIDNFPMTINNGKFNSKKDIFECQKSNITVKNGEFTSDGYIFNCINCQIAVDDGSFNADIYAVNVSEACDVTINGGVYTSSGAVVLCGENSNVTINGGAFTSYAESGLYFSDSTVEITNGTISAYGDAVCAKDSNITVNGGSIISDDYYAFYTESSTVTINGGEFFSENYYTVDIDKSSVIEINDGTFTSEYYSPLCVEDNSTATINGGKFIAEYDNALYFITSTVEINDGTFISARSAEEDGMNASESVVTINGGHFEAGDDALHFSNSEAVINNVDISNSGYGISACDESTVIINNASVNTRYDALYMNYQGSTDTKIIINGGSYKSINFSDIGASESLTVNNGFFDAPLDRWTTQYLRGGYYTTDPTDYIVEPGYNAKPTDESDKQNGVDINAYLYKIAGSTGTNTLSLKYNLSVIKDIEYNEIGDNAEISLSSIEPKYEVIDEAGEDYHFDKYYTDDKYTIPAEFPLIVTGDTTLYGKYVPVDKNETFTVTVDYNGHGGGYVKTVKNVPYGAAPFDVILCAFLDMPEYNDIYIGSVRTLTNKELVKCIPQEAGYVLLKNADNAESVMYGLKKTYSELYKYENEQKYNSFHYNVIKDTTYYLQWFRIIDKSFTSVIDAQQPVCGQKEMDFESLISAEYPESFYIDCQTYCESGVLKHNAYCGDNSYSIFIEFNAKYGYLFDKELMTTKYPDYTYNIINKFDVSYGDYYCQQESTAFFNVLHNWNEAVDMTDEEIAEAWLDLPDEGYKWVQRSCSYCNEIEYLQIPINDTASVYTITVDMGTRMDNFVIDNVKPGTMVYQGIGNDILEILEYAEADDEIYKGLASKPMSMFTSEAELESDIDNTTNELTVTDHDITVYPVYYKTVIPEIIFNSVPVCGQTARDAKGDLIAPDVELPASDYYTLSDAAFKSDEFYPIEDVFKGGNNCVVDFAAAVKPGYKLNTNGSKIVGADYEYCDDRYDLDGNLHVYVVLKINHVHNENSKVLDEITFIDNNNPCISPRIHHTKIECGVEGCDGIVEETFEVLPAEHEWDKPTYTWSDDLSKVTATQICKVNPEHIRTIEVEATASEKKAASCEDTGIMTYTATFDIPEFETQTTDTEIPAKGHDWSEPAYTWADDYSTVTAERTCKNDPTHKETEKAETTSKETKAAKCEETGILTYTAEFTNPAFETQTTDTEIPEIGHKWRTPTYSWSEDYSRVYAERVCENDIAHRETEDVAATSEVKLAPTCEHAGIMIYTAVFTNPVFEKQTFEVAIPATGHDWGEPTYTWAKDYSTVTAERVCKKDTSHIETEIAKTTYEVKAEPTFAEAGIGRYTSNEFKNSAFTVQKIDVAIPAKLCTVTFDSNGGTPVETQEVPYNGYAEKPQDPTKENCTFKGWYLDDTEYDFSTPVTGDITLTAKWEEISLDTDTETDTETDTDTATDTETDTNTAADTETDTDTAADTETDTDTAADTETDTDTATDTETDTDTAADTETDTDTAADTETDTDTAADTETDTDTATDTETDDDFMYGDVNFDGKVTAKDSMMTQRYTIKLAALTEKQLKAADVDLDGKITAKDALYILRCSINLAVLPIEK